jgi:hypothetical protein
VGDMAEYYKEQELLYGDTWPDDTMFRHEIRVTRASRWKTRDGKLIAIWDMTTEHLTNILKMHDRGRLHMPDVWRAALEREAARR